MIIEKILIIITLLLVIYYIVEKLIGKLPIVKRKIRYEREEFEILLKIVLLRGYHSSPVISGRFIVESMDERGKKIVFKKYYFWERYGLEMYIPLITGNEFRGIKEFTKKEKIEIDLWKEWRREFNREVVGIDIKDDIETGLKLLEYSMEIILKEENANKRLKVYFKEISPFREHYIYDLEEYERDPEKRKKLEKPFDLAGLLAYFLNAQD